MFAFRGPTPSRVGADRQRSVQYGSVETPGGLHLVSSDKERLIGGENIQQQGFISFWQRAQTLRIPKFETLSVQRDLGTWKLNIEVQVKALIRLKGNHRDTGRELIRTSTPKECHGWRTKPILQAIRR